MNFRELLENKEIVFEELVENKKIVFRRESLNGQFILRSVTVPKKVADTLIKNTEYIESGLLKFTANSNEVIIEYNLWYELNLNKYPEYKYSELP